MYDAVLKRERTRARSVAMIPGHIGATRCSQPSLGRVTATLLVITPAEYVACRRFDPVIVFGALPLLFFGDPKGCNRN